MPTGTPFLLSLFHHMLVIGNMVLTIAVIAIALRTVAELQFRIAHICATANRATMGVILPHHIGALLGRIGELHRAGAERWHDDMDFVSGARRMMRKGL